MWLASSLSLASKLAAGWAARRYDAPQFGVSLPEGGKATQQAKACGVSAAAPPSTAIPMRLILRAAGTVIQISQP